MAFILLDPSLHLFLVTGLLGEIASGIYALANKVLTMVLNVLPDKVYQEVISALFYREYGRQEPKRVQFGFDLLLKLSMLASVPVAAWLALMARPLVMELFDARCARSEPVLAISAGFLVVIMLHYPLAILLRYPLWRF